MKEVLPKLSQKTLTGSPSVIFSLVSAAGLSRSDLREFRKMRLSGREARLASRSAQRESNSDSSTRDTSHLCSSTSSASAALQSSLGSRLRQQLQNRGCAIYKLIWREKTTPSGFPYSQLVASVPRIKENDSSLARTTWPSPCAQNGTVNGYKDPEKVIKRKEAGRQQNLQDVVILTQPIRITASGQMLTGSDAGMENSGQLNPAHSRWLMGYPPEWDDCAVTAMPSSRK